MSVCVFVIDIERQYSDVYIPHRRQIICAQWNLIRFSRHSLIIQQGKTHVGKTQNKKERQFK